MYPKQSKGSYGKTVILDSHTYFALRNASIFEINLNAEKKKSNRNLFFKIVLTTAAAAATSTTKTVAADQYNEKLYQVKLWSYYR